MKMLKLIKHFFCFLLQIPDKPSPPIGTVGTLKVFRAAPNFLKYRYLRFFGIGFLNNLIIVIYIAADVGSSFSGPPSKTALIVFFVILGFYLFTLFVSCIVGVFTIMLDYDFRWYQVTDRSLRIREGLIKVKEMTVTFDNVQEVSVEQGPIQRIFGIADVIVRTAGGKNPLQNAQNKNQPQSTDFHKAVFRGVGNAPEIRDLIQKRVRSIKTMGIGESPVQIQKPKKTVKGLLSSPARRSALAAIHAEASELRTYFESVKR